MRRKMGWGNDNKGIDSNQDGKDGDKDNKDQ